MKQALRIITAAALLIFSALCVLLHTMPDRLVGAAFCHQLISRSPSYGFPFCYRCSGLFSGILCSIIFSILAKKKEKLFSVPVLLGGGIALMIFAADIINSAEYIPLHWYDESVKLRFLSAFPLGFMLVQVISPLFFAVSGSFAPAGILPQKMLIPGMALGCAIAFLIIFSSNRILIRFFRGPIAVGALLFLMILYFIVIKCLFMLRGKNCRDVSAAFAALSLAVFQICLFGGIHIQFLPFDQIFG